jgi:hypothetical protein
MTIGEMQQIIAQKTGDYSLMGARRALGGSFYHQTERSFSKRLPRGALVGWLH